MSGNIISNHQNKKTPKQDIYTMRKRKKQRKVIQQTFWMLFLTITILVLYQRRDSWLPKLETIGIHHENHRQGSIGESIENFPLYINGGSEYDADAVSGKLVILSDSYLHVYETDGELLSSRQHTYGSAMMQTSGEYILIYENGGTHFRLETVSKTHFEKNLSDPIIFGRISENGQIILVTSAKNCVCKMFVFNQKGQQIYERDCVDRLIDALFYPDDSGCFVVSMEGVNGSIQSTVHSYSFTQKRDIWVSQPLDMTVFSIYNTVDGSVFALGDTQCCYLDAKGNIESQYVYPNELKKGICVNGTAMLVLTNHEMRSESLVMLHEHSLVPIVKQYDKEIKNIGWIPETDSVLVHLRNQFDTIDQNGEVINTLQTADGFNRFIQIGHTLFLCGYDSIDKIEYKF